MSTEKEKEAAREEFKSYISQSTWTHDVRPKEEVEKENRAKERNYWRRLIAAHLAPAFSQSRLPMSHEQMLVACATDILNELERIEKLEAGEKSA